MHPLTLTTLQTTIPLRHSELEEVKKELGSWLKNKGFRQHGYIHNHENEEDPGFKRNEYPLVQLRCPDGKLLLWGMNAGAEALQAIMMQEMMRDFRVKGVPWRIVPDRTGTERAELGFLTGKQTSTYSLNYFVALNPANARAWQALPTAARRMERLEELLKNNIAMFCKAAGFVLDKEKLLARINWVWKTEWVRIKEHQVLGFTLDYQSNLLMPDGIGLGRQTKLGYGWQTARTVSATELLTPTDQDSK